MDSNYWAFLPLFVALVLGLMTLNNHDDTIRELEERIEALEQGK
jgi:hypothetical protein